MTYKTFDIITTTYNNGIAVKTNVIHFSNVEAATSYMYALRDYHTDNIYDVVFDSHDWVMEIEPVDDQKTWKIHIRMTPAILHIFDNHKGITLVKLTTENS